MSESGRRMGDVELGKRIKEQREKKGLSQKELAAKARVSEEHISLIESGRRSPSWMLVKRMSIALDVSASYILGDSVSAMAPDSITPAMVGELVAETIENMQNTIDALRAELEIYRPKARPDE